MTNRWLAITNNTTEAILVCMDVDVETKQVISLVNDSTYKLQQGDLPEAFRRMGDCIQDYITEKKVEIVFVQATSINPGGITGVHLDAALLRGSIILAASRTNAKVILQRKQETSKKIGKRNVDDYAKDNGFWNEFSLADLRAKSRPTAAILIAELR